MSHNPLLEPFTTPHETFPFNSITAADIEQALLRGMEIHREEIEQIATQTAQPTFENTILPLERSGKLLAEAHTLLSNIFCACTNDEIDALCEKMSPIIARHHTELALDARIFARVMAVHDAKPQLDEEDAK
ncbi:MAG: peptidase M3, partial [Bacteroidaceae bacterium]|nr:peptidase M3 [Bacteroidaceae bacterium]